MKFIIIEAEELKKIIKNKAHNENSRPQDIMQMYFFERLLYRISISKYRHNFILKGGLLLSALFKDNRRTTQDMDTMIKRIPLDYETLKNILEEIIGITVNDGIKYEILKSKNIRVNDKYSGLRIVLMGYKEHLKVPLSIDITVGDIITPRELEFKYKCMFTDEYINIMAFNNETILAEKFETFITDNIINTRSKDFYDMYMLIKKFYNSMDKNVLRQAIKNTFERRNSIFDLDVIERNYKLICENEGLKRNFKNFQNKKVYAKNVTYEEIMYEINIIINLLLEESISV